ncbi:sulfatase-like hydrolase/transferase [Chryseolinea lacunae]|uniref:Sulfatase-like hydrolase/transferase n=1 Tax=Chryseolinea lacunae TaxID=2801331 RepID=A0ABS1L1Y0_9BACT|nr:sulfatase-like hydrolase/transferase [Chryseolinea lacunae]MBL0745547.1 sulfatase-like hydrolase/transferase [Chryseolinea lacunae]
MKNFQHDRRSFLRTMSFAAGALAIPSALHALAARSRKLNVIILLTDDQRFDTIAALWKTQAITPNMDALAKNGTAFTQAHTMGGLSGALCQPSRAMLLTGRTLFNIDRQAKDNQEYSFDIYNNYITLPEYLKKQGYNTVGIGKQHNGTEVYARAFSDGAKVFFGGMSDQYKIPHQDFAADGKYPKERTYFSEGKHSSEIYADETIRFIEKYKTSPFFIYTAFQSPHDPREFPESYKALYDVDKIQLPPNYLPQHPFDNGELNVRDELLAPFPRTEEDTRKQLRDYYAIISHLDAQVGRIVKSVKDNGLENDTIVVLAGDNGLAVGQHGLFGKQSVYEHSLRVPLIIAGPDIPKNQRVDSLCYLTDIYATLAERLEVAVPTSVQSESLNPAIKNPKAVIRPSLYLVYKHYQRGVKKNGFKLIEYNVKGERHTQLFDLTKDPYEITNLATDKTYAAKLGELREELKALRVKHKDNFSPFWDGYEG